MSERGAYKEAADFHVAIVGKVRPEQWDQPGLGEWSARELAAHTSRAMLTVEHYAANPGQELTMDSALAYYRRAMSGEDINQVVAERGRSTAREIGDDLPRFVAALRDRIARLIDTLADDFVFGTNMGGIELRHYPPTRTVELVVHTLDLQRAIGNDDAPPADAIRMTLHVLADLAVDSPHAGRLALLATGREVWEGPFTVLG
jgi:uncharacterized protein (TIGR03083 family)